MPVAKTRVAITGFGGLDNPEPGTPVARALKAGWGAPIEIDALCYDAWTTGGWMPGVADRLHLVPPVAQGDETTLARVLEIHKKHPLDAIIPCLDLEVPVYSRLSRRLARAGIKTLLPAPEDARSIVKTALPSFCYANDIATPRTVWVPNVEDVPLYADRFGYPLMVKGTVAGAQKVHDRDQAYFAAVPLNAKWGGGVLLQEVIEGDEYVVAMVARGDGSCLSMVPMRKLGLNHRGKGVVGAVVADPDLKRTAQRILSKLHWRGALELEFVRSREKSQFYLIEVNCRFPSWIALSAFAGCSLPKLLLKEMLDPGGRVGGRARPGAAYVRDVQETAVPVESLRRLQRFGSTEVTAPALVKSRGDGLSVAVTGVSSFDLTMPGLGVARALRGAPEVGRVYGLAYDVYETGLYRPDTLDGGFRILAEDEDNDGERLVDQLGRIRRKVGLDVVMPCLDHELPRFQKLAGELSRLGIRTLLPSPRSYARTRKKALFIEDKRREWGGFELPPTLPIRSVKDVDAAWRQFGSPMMIKGIEAGALPAYNLFQARTIWAMRRQAGETMALAQPMIYGEEFGVAVVSNRQRQVVGSLAIKKLLACDRGKMWGAVPADLPDLIAGLKSYLEEIGWVGPCDADFIRDSVCERFTLIEINPRFPAWIGFSALIGENLPRQAVRAALDMEPAPCRPERDSLFMRSCVEMPVDAFAFASFASRGEIKHDAACL